MGNEGLTVKGNAYQVGAEVYIPYGTTGTPPLTNDPNHYWEQINHDEYGRSYILRTKVKPRAHYSLEEYETLRSQYSEAMIAAEKAKDIFRVNEKLQEIIEGLNNQIANMSGELEILYEANRKLTNERSVDKECGMAEQSPEAKAYEDMHTKRMDAEIEAIKLDNLKKRAELNGYEDYPHSVWEVLSDRTRKLKDSLTLRSRIIWVALVAFGVNEVIQWLTR